MTNAPSLCSVCGAYWACDCSTVTLNPLDWAKAPTNSLPGAFADIKYEPTDSAAKVLFDSEKMARSWQETVEQSLAFREKIRRNLEQP